MRVRGVVFALLLLSAIVFVPRPVAAPFPVIQNVSWSPWVPARGEMVIVYADISDPDGVSSALVLWCVIPPDTCMPFDMADPDHDGRWNTTGILVVGPPSTGADFNITATDAGGNTTYSPLPYYVQFGDAIGVDASLNVTSTTPGATVSVSGIAKYAYDNGTGQLQTNDSTPAKDSTVGIRIVETGATTSDTTDGSGNIAASFTAPAVDGTYTVNVTVSNRTLTGYKVLSLGVATAPTPDLAVVLGSLVASPNPARAGDAVAFTFKVENRGTATAAGFTVRLAIEDASSAEVFRHDFTSVTLAPTENTSLSTTWTAVQGQMTVTVSIDPNGLVTEISEANNNATLALTVEPLPNGGLSTTLIVILALLAIGAAVAAVLVFRRRKAGQPKEPQ